MKEHEKQFVLSLVAYCVQRGIQADQLCAHSNIDLSALKSREAIVFTPKQISDLWKNASHLCQDDLIGLHFGESLQLAALGTVGEIIKSSDTVGQAIHIACSLTPAITDLYTMEVVKDKKAFNIELKRTKVLADEFVCRQVADLLMVFTIHELNGLLLERIHPDSVTYPFKLSKPKEFERVFRCKRIKRTYGYGMQFKSAYWEEPILSANYELQKLFLQKLSSSTDHQTPSAVSFQVRVMDFLMKNSYLGILSLEDVAANFNITPRSLQRRLQSESATFQQIAEAVRKSLAMHYLEVGKYQIKEIASILGYNEVSAFSRAYKRWTGKNPSEA